MMQRITPSYYEFVKKSDYGPIRERFENDILPIVREELRAKEYTFQFSLMGSGSRRLVTRIIGGNKGFDLDYDFDIQYVPEKADAKKIKLDFMRALDNASKPFGYKPCEDSTNVITFKMIDEEGSRIIHSFDIALTCSDDSNRLFIKNDKKSRAYIWNLRRSGIDLDAKIEELKNELGGECHSAIADEYLKLKNRNIDGDKRSFVLYAEAVCNLHNQVFQSSDDEYDDDDDYRCPKDWKLTSLTWYVI